MGVPIWTRVAHVLSARGEFLQLECWGPWGLVPWKSGKLQVLSVISGFQSGEWLQLRPAKCLQAPHSKILVISWPSIPTIDIHRPCNYDEFGRLQFQEIGQYQHLKLVINCSLPFISQKMLIVWLFRDYINMSVCHAKACCSSEDKPGWADVKRSWKWWTNGDGPGPINSRKNTMNMARVDAVLSILWRVVCLSLMFVCTNSIPENDIPPKSPMYSVGSCHFGEWMGRADWCWLGCQAFPRIVWDYHVFKLRSQKAGHGWRVFLMALSICIIWT